jgi:putative ABC transport system permease protein
MDALFQDVRYGVRTLLRSPGLALAAVVTLGIGIGATSSIFSVVNAVLLRPLPLAAPERLVTVNHDFRQAGTQRGPLSFVEYEEHRERSRLFEGFAGYSPLSANLTGGERPERVACLFVTVNYFSVLGVAPHVGRLFAPEDERPGIAEVAVISHGVWQRLFGADPGLLGRRLRIDGDDYTVVGVLPPAFRDPDSSLRVDTDVWSAAGFKAAPFTAPSRADRRLSVIARLRPGIGPKTAQAEMDSLARRLEHEQPDHYGHGVGFSVALHPLHEQVVGEVRPILLVLLGAVGFVLALACANVANLLLARATARRREVALRAALGASRGRVVRQLLTEAVLLAAVGGAFGLSLAVAGVDGLVALIPPGVPRVHEIRLDEHVLVFTALVTLATGVLFGLAPAFGASRAEAKEALREGTRAGEGAHSTRLRSLLVVAELALAVVLVTGAGLLVRSLGEVLRVNPGFDSRNVLSAWIWLPYPNDPERGRYTKGPQRTAFFQELLGRVSALPGVRSAGVISSLPLTGGRPERPLLVEGQGNTMEESRARVDAYTVSPGYFEAMRMPLRRGRWLDEHDDAASPLVAVINEAMARRFWPGEEAIGKRVSLRPAFGSDLGAQPWMTVVGVVGDVKARGLDAPVPDQVYLPYGQGTPLWMVLVVRTASDPAALASALTRTVHLVDPEQPVYNVRTMDAVLASASSSRSFAALLLGLLAAVALLMAALGTYGVVAYTVAQRARELAVRMALGARGADVVRLVLGRSLRLVAGGVGLGVVASMGLTRLLSSLLFGVAAHDPTTFAATAALLALMALVASYLPGRQAARVDPMVSLRRE